MVCCNGRIDVEGNETCQPGCIHTHAHPITIYYLMIFLIIIYNMHQAFLTGCSAGGLATIIHCDEFRSLFPMTTKVKCLSDAGLFLDA